MYKMLLIISVIAVAAGVVAISNAQQNPPDSLLQGIKAEQDSYSLGQSVKFSYVLKNRSSRPITYNFSSSKQYDMWVMIGDKEIYRYSKGRMYTMAFTSLTINPNQTRTFNIVWNQKDNDGHDIGPGVYNVYAQLTPTKDQPPATTGKVRIGVGKIALVPISVSDAIKRSDDLLGKRVQIQATYKGWQPTADDPNVQDGPPVTRSDWAICDSTACMYVTGKIDLDPVKGIGTPVNLIGKLQKTKKGQVYLVLESAKIGKAT